MYLPRAKIIGFVSAAQKKRRAVVNLTTLLIEIDYFLFVFFVVIIIKVFVHFQSVVYNSFVIFIL